MKEATSIDQQDAITIAAEQCDCDMNNHGHSYDYTYHHGACQHDYPASGTNSTCSSSCDECNDRSDPIQTTTSSSTHRSSMNNNNKLPPTEPTFADDHLPLGGQYPQLIASSRKRKARRQTCAMGKLIVYFLFLLIIGGGIATFFCWPRTPMVSISSHVQPHTGTTWTDKRMEAIWWMNMTLDNRENWIPTRLARIELTMVDSVTLIPFATATVNDLVLGSGMLVVVPNMTFHVLYLAREESDTTWKDLYRACGPHTDRPALNMNMKIVFHFQGILWTSTVNASPPSGGFVCPS